MNRIDSSRFPLVESFQRQVPLIWNKICNFLDKNTVFSVMGKEDPFLWENFREKIKEQSIQSQEKVRNIFKKHGVDVSKNFLEKKHVNLALAALHTLYVADLGENARQLEPKQVTAKIKSLVQALPPLPSVKGPKEGLKGVYEMICQDSISRDQERSLFVKELSKLKTPESYWEYLTKLIAGRDLEEGMIIPALGGEDFYYIYRKINKSGLIAYALKPLYEKSDLKPVLFFRPTQMSISSEKMLDTLMDNFSLNGVGYEGFYAAEKDLSALMKDEEFRALHEKIVVAGYSLGGAHAQRFIAHSDNWKHFSEAIIFNSPGVDVKTSKIFAFKVNMGSFLLAHTPALLFFRTEGDPIDQGGERHLGAGIFSSSNIHMQLTRIFPLNHLENYLTRHLSCYLHQDPKIEVFDLKKSTNHHFLSSAKIGEERSFLENLRQWVGFFFRPLYYVVSFFRGLVDIIFLQERMSRIRLLLDGPIRWMRNNKE